MGISTRDYKRIEFAWILASLLDCFKLDSKRLIIKKTYQRGLKELDSTTFLVPKLTKSASILEGHHSIVISLQCEGPLDKPLLLTTQIARILFPVDHQRP